MHRASPTDIMLMKKEQKDAELDKKIEALRKKNEALVKRYQEVEEDKKRAEKEGMALQMKKGNSEDLTITVNKSLSEPRVVTKRRLGTGSSQCPRVVHSLEEGHGGQTGHGRGKRRQLLVTMMGNTKGRRVVSERPEEGQKGTERRKHTPITKRVKGTQENGAKQDVRGQEEETECFPEGFAHHEEAEEPESRTLLDDTTSQQEEKKYLLWKKEREQIDRERVARHKNSKGQWRRAWDMDKPDLFSEKADRKNDQGTHNRGGKNSRGSHLKSPAEFRSHQVSHRDKRGKNVPVVSSKAKGKDRLTGRARKWDAKEEEEQVQVSEVNLKEFLEELDALCDPQVDDLTLQTGSPETEKESIKLVISKDTSAPTDFKSVTVSESFPSETVITDTAAQKGLEKKVRFSENFIQEASKQPSNCGTSEQELYPSKGALYVTTDPGDQEPNQTSQLKQEGINTAQELALTDGPVTDIQNRYPSSEQEQGMIELPKLSAVSIIKTAESESVITLSQSSSSQNIDDASALEEKKMIQTLQHTKSNTSRSTEEMIDSSLSMLSLDSEKSLPDHNTSTEKARENGKIV